MIRRLMLASLGASLLIVSTGCSQQFVILPAVVHTTSPPPDLPAQKTPLLAVIAESPTAPDRWRWYYSSRPRSVAADYGWKQLGTAFVAYSAQVPGTVPVYCETPAYAPHSHYHFAIRPAAQAARYGWKRLFVAFYAYPNAQPGTVPVYMETPTHAPQTRYRLSTRSKAAAGARTSANW